MGRPALQSLSGTEARQMFHLMADCPVWYGTEEGLETNFVISRAEDGGVFGLYGSDFYYHFLSSSSVLC